MKAYKLFLGSLAIGALLAVVPGRILAGDAATPAKKTYLRYCSACHGETGKGDGVVSGLMRPKPTDLTALSKENKGEFPYARVLQVIDGRQVVSAHGNAEMPVWGEVFLAEDGTNFARQAQVRGKVMLIIDHLISIQAK